jgi:hypothetical protein
LKLGFNIIAKREISNRPGVHFKEGGGGKKNVQGVYGFLF